MPPTEPLSQCPLREANLAVRTVDRDPPCEEDYARSGVVDRCADGSWRRFLVSVEMRGVMRPSRAGSVRWRGAEIARPQRGRVPAAGARVGLLVGLFLVLSASAQAATFTVTTLNDSGVGSLRQAILDANATAGADTITFSSG